MTKTDTVYTAINAVMQEIERVGKDGENKHFRYKYVSESAFIETLRPLMVTNGLVVVPVGMSGIIQHVPTNSNAGGLTFLDYGFKMVHAPTGTETDVCRMPACGQDSGDKGPYKAMTGALKYFLRHIFLVSTGDDPEKDSQSHQAAPRAATRGSVVQPDEIPLYSRDDYEQHIQPAPANTQHTPKKQSPTKREKLVIGYHHHLERIGEKMTEAIVKAHYTGTLDLSTIDENTFEQIVVAMKEAVLDPKGAKE